MVAPVHFDPKILPKGSAKLRWVGPEFWPEGKQFVSGNSQGCIRSSEAAMGEGRAAPRLACQKAQIGGRPKPTSVVIWVFSQTCVILAGLTEKSCRDLATVILFFCQNVVVVTSFDILQASCEFCNLLSVCKDHLGTLRTHPLHLPCHINYTINGSRDNYRTA